MMLSTESRRGRTIVLHLEAGDELPGSLIRALDGLEVKSGWVSGAGLLEAAEVRLPLPRNGATAFNVEGPLVLASLSGPLQVHDGVLAPLLWASIAKAGELGPAVVAGELAWGAVQRVDLVVSVFDDVAPGRAEAPVVSPPAAPPPRAVSSVAAPLVTPPPQAAPPAPAPAPRPVNTPTPAVAGPVPVPMRPHRAEQPELETYPEVGDLVVHFAFGRCEVILSDGDKISIREDGGRTRSVGLAMLRIGKPTVDEATGKRLFELGRRL